METPATGFQTPALIFQYNCGRPGPDVGMPLTSVIVAVNIRLVVDEVFARLA
jgi:hypothetical protein